MRNPNKEAKHFKKKRVARKAISKAISDYHATDGNNMGEVEAAVLFYKALTDSDITKRECAFFERFLATMKAVYGAPAYYALAWKRFNALVENMTDMGLEELENELNEIELLMQKTEQRNNLRLR